MRRITVCILAFLLVSLLNASEDIGETNVREKRVSSSAVDNKPSSDVGFDNEQGGKKAKGSSFRKMMDDAGAISGPKAYKFPIIMPPYIEGGESPTSTKPEWGTCLLYIESVSVIVFTTEQQMSSAVATVDSASGKNTFNFGGNAISCLQNATAGKDSTHRNSGSAWKFIDPIQLLLNFERNSDFSWHLSSVVADSLKVRSGSWLKKDLEVPKGDLSVNANRTVKISGFNDFSYACSSTPAIVWDLQDKFSLGVSFNNIQLQPVGIDINTGRTKGNVVKFGRKVNDCVGLFSVGSWMGIVVAVVLLMVLFFGYLMLNSVQTMDRFDDPKQKQLIINAKE
uniref:V-type proton ATPase subunit S1/VOA1 transmembrane domain-containing protein n=1 Tax=Ditylenchus dipsaci TaxID=166011 RepID=A0A915D217_9BILA